MSSSTLVPSTLSTANLASTLRDAAELVVDVTTASAKSISDALPDSVPEFAASLPAVIPFVGSHQARRRLMSPGRIVVVGAVLASVVAVAMVLRTRTRGESHPASTRNDSDRVVGEAFNVAVAG